MTDEDPTLIMDLPLRQSPSDHWAVPLFIEIASSLMPRRKERETRRWGRVTFTIQIQTPQQYECYQGSFETSDLKEIKQ